MSLVDRILVVLFILIISILVIYFLYFYGNEEILNIFVAIAGTAGVLLGIYEFIRKKDE
jgi:hypothetical protein